MYYGEGRLFGNMGVYVVEEAEDTWSAELLLRDATATQEQVSLPTNLIVVPKRKEEQVRDAIETPPTRRRGVYHLRSGVTFLEFTSLSDFDA